MGVCFVDLEKAFNCVLQDVLHVMGDGGAGGGLVFV